MLDLATSLCGCTLPLPFLTETFSFSLALACSDDAGDLHHTHFPLSALSVTLLQQQQVRSRDHRRSRIIAHRHHRHPLPLLGYPSPPSHYPSPHFYEPSLLFPPPALSFSRAAWSHGDLSVHHFVPILNMYTPCTQCSLSFAVHYM
ncbi:hypothetical protein BD410DRAFT_103645 [Rickenella mellea]|uniref:Uncharacterized protein n=1 Tax=Rickenella mellea TaxID=50990 RepID=A0A4Y7PKE3_9AGAM|nr:hypothetical protein BD410DRAFT_103645 [Rickenella mellea]